MDKGDRASFTSYTGPCRQYTDTDKGDRTSFTSYTGPCMHYDDMDKGKVSPTRRAGELEGFAVGAPPELAAVGVGLVVLAVLTGDARTLCRGAVAVAIHTDCSCNTRLHIATHGYALQHMATHCNTLLAFFYVGFYLV